MATYTYKCLNIDCNIKFDIKQSMKDNKIILCNKCKQESLERVPQKTNFNLKGNWFKNGGY